MKILTPKRLDFLIHLFGVLPYFAVFVAGVGSIFFPPASIAQHYDNSVTVVMGVYITGAAIPAAYGAMRRLWLYEWAFIWFICGGIATYATVLWTSLGTTSRIVPACMTSIALLWFFRRGLFLTSVRNRARHERDILK